MVDMELVRKIVDIIEPRIRERHPKSFEEEFAFMIDELILDKGDIISNAWWGFFSAKRDLDIIMWWIQYKRMRGIE